MQDTAKLIKDNKVRESKKELVTDDGSKKRKRPRKQQPAAAEDKNPSNDENKRGNLPTDHDHDLSTQVMVKEFKSSAPDKRQKEKSVAVNQNPSSIADEISIDEAHKTVLLNQNDVNGHAKEGTSLADELIRTNNETEEKTEAPNEIIPSKDVGEEPEQIGASVVVNDILPRESSLPAHTHRTCEKEELQLEIKEAAGSAKLIKNNKVRESRKQLVTVGTFLPLTTLVNLMKGKENHQKKVTKIRIV